MNARSTKYLIGEGFRNVWTNRLMSLASIGVLVACMLIMGVAFALTENINEYLGILQEQNVVMVYFDEELEDTEAKALSAKIGKMDNISDSIYKPRDPALNDLLDSMDLTEDQQELFNSYLEGDNPLPNGAEVHLKDLEKFDKTVKALEKTDGVSVVRHQRAVAEQIVNIKNIVNIASASVMLLLLVIATVIICNTIRITMYSRKLEISIMKAVGATDPFIRAPFMVEGIIIGLFAAIFSTALLYTIYTIAGSGLAESMGGIELIPFRELALKLFGIFALIGVGIGLIGSRFTIAKYLRKEGSEFRAL